MHDITFIRENPDLFDELLKKRFIDPKSNEIISLDIKKRDILTKSQELRAERKNLSSSFANLNEGDKADLQKKVQLIKNKIDELENDISIRHILEHRKINDISELNGTVGKIFILKIDPVELTSTEIRDSIRKNEDVSSLLNQDVYQLIKDKNLYKR